MFRKKLTSIITSGVMCLSMASGIITASAEETDEKLYTLQELFEMSDEEFLALDYYGLNLDFTYLKNQVRGFEKFVPDGEYEHGGLTGELIKYFSDTDWGVNYIANTTEAEIEKLLGDTVEYSIYSPVFGGIEGSIEAEYYYYYRNSFRVYFPDYEIITYKRKATDDEVMEFLKCYYCVRQVCDMEYCALTDVGGIQNPKREKVLNGDVNLDRKVDLTDIEYMEKGLSGELDLMEAQQKIADVNGDGEFNNLDVEFLNNQLLNADKYNVLENVEASKYGDLNGTETVDVADLVKLNLFLLNPDEYPLTDVQKANADCCKDGVIDANDCTTIMNYVSMLIDMEKLGK